MSDDLKFTCEVCGKDFDADPDTMVECGIGPQQVDLKSAGNLIESGQAITAEELAEMDAEELQEIGLTTKQRDKLLAGEEITTGGMCICKECQDEALEGEE